MRNISNSEVISWLSCRRQYKYAHLYNIEPKQMSEPLFRGNLGHEAMQRYTEARIEGADHDKAMYAGQDLFPTALRANPNMMQVVLQTKSIWERYMNHHKGWPEWKLHEPEQKFELPLNDDFKIVIRYDAKIEERRTGRMLIGDYKYAYDFWSPEDHDLNPQMPKYIAVMNANGIRIDGGFLEEIRTREIKDINDHKKLWRRTFYYPSNAKRINMLRQHIGASFEITDYRELPKEEQEAKAIPVLNKHGACRFCNFKDLCNSENDGKDITYDIEVSYKENTYGYNKEEVISQI